MSIKISVTRNHNFSSGLVTRAALNAGATPTVSLTGSVDTAEIADASITNGKVSATAAISLSKLGDLDAGNILTGGGSFPVATSLLSSTNFSDPHHSISSSPATTYKATLLLGNDTTAVTAVMSGDAELKADGALIIDPTFVSGKSALVAQTSEPDATMIADTDTLLVVDNSETPDKYKKITFAHLKTSIDTTSNAAADDSAGVAELATYGETFTGTDSTRIVTANNIKAHPIVPIAWARFTGSEDDANHSDRTTATDTSENPGFTINQNISGCSKTALGSYTVTIANCPSSNIMVTGDVIGWGDSADGNSDNGRAYPLAMIQTATSGGDPINGSSATIQFKTQYYESNSGTYQNFKEARLVFYAK